MAKGNNLTRQTTLLRAEAGDYPVGVLGPPECFQTAWRTQDAELGTRGILAVKYLHPQTTYNLDVARLQCDTLHMKHYEIGVLKKPNKICFGSRVESCEGVSHCPVPAGLMLSRLGCKDVADEPAI